MTVYYIKKLNADDAEQVKPLFIQPIKYMGISETYANNSQTRNNQYQLFCEAYLNNLQLHHAYGAYTSDTNNLISLMTFYQSVDEPSWYFTMGRSLGYYTSFRPLLEYIIDVNERSGRFKFFTVMNFKHAELVRRLVFSEQAKQRYGYFDEYFVPAKTRCVYGSHWEILYRRCLCDVDTVVRCSYLKPEYRESVRNIVKGGI